MTSLIDRYVYTALRRVPEQQRGDIDRELRASIEDAVDARVDSGEERDAAIETTLVELGDPGRLADRYAGRSNFLIGPELYPMWRRLLITLLATVLPIVVLVGVIVQILDDPNIGKVIGGAVTTILTVGVQMTFWVTAAFAVLEHTGVGRESMKLDRPWTPKDLPRYEPNNIPRSEVITGVVWAVLLIAGLVLQQFTFSDVPVLDPANWTFWWPYMIVSLVLSAAFHVWLYRHGRYDRKVTVVNLVQQLISMVPLVWLLVTDRFFNPEFDWFAAADADVKGWVTKGLLLAVAVSVIDIVKVAIRGERARRGLPSKVPGTGNYNFG
ncbi:hypothetical protein GCM10010172_73230 [Paractinoplanes ferrugineus]|uniref:Uncharacterized protein n=1 Tax=Paractinoplanes ferrugineus TaxID=113564 RepID=A0A919MKT7_9ACTN|nr:permease prefix domain 1-containing protein [Actinoplanes ferrugineus]GIE11522.1 hypothetical protein Afe05nite_33620 [Actinoplanes ferrugineus]